MAYQMVRRAMRPKETPPRNDLTRRGPARAPARTFAEWRGSCSERTGSGLMKLNGLSEALVPLRHVPVDAGHGNRLGAHHDVVDNVIDDVHTRRAEVLMHQEIAGAVVVEVADATHADVRASYGDSGG